MGLFDIVILIGPNYKRIVHDMKEHIKRKGFRINSLIQQSSNIKKTESLTITGCILFNSGYNER